MGLFSAKDLKGQIPNLWLSLRWFTSNKSKKVFHLPSSSGKAAHKLISVMGRWWNANPVKSTICLRSFIGWKALCWQAGTYHLTSTMGWSVSIQVWQRKFICVSIFVHCCVLLYMDTWGAVEYTAQCWFGVAQSRVYYKATWHKTLWNEILFFFFKQTAWSCCWIWWITKKFKYTAIPKCSLIFYFLINVHVLFFNS